jgi:hypothetical protein
MGHTPKFESNNFHGVPSSIIGRLIRQFHLQPAINQPTSKTGVYIP